MNYTVWMDPKQFAAIATDVASKPQKLSMWFGEHEMLSQEMEFKAAALSPENGLMLIEFAPVVPVVEVTGLKLVAKEIKNGPVGSVTSN